MSPSDVKLSLCRRITGACVVQSIQGDAPVVPENEEYGISSFVYRARRPFHAQRLHAFIEKYYTLQEEEMQGDSDEEGEQHDCLVIKACKVAVLMNLIPSRSKAPSRFEAQGTGKDCMTGSQQL